MKLARNWQYLAIVVFLRLPTWGLAAEPVEADASVSQRLKAAVDHAETYYRLAVEEQGDPLALEAGQRHLKDAEQLLKGVPAAEADRFARRIATLKTDLTDQRNAIGGTLDGVFPLARLLSSSLFVDGGTAAAYVLTGDPAVKASMNAVAQLKTLATDLEKDRRQPQLPLVIITVPWNRTVEHQSIAMFRALPRFQVQTYAEAEAALDPGERKAIVADGITPAVERGLLKRFGAAKLLVVTIHRTDVADDVYYYRARGQVLDAAGNSPQESFVTGGFARDRRDRLAWTLLANVALLTLAYAAYALVVYTHRAMAIDASWKLLLVAPLVAFAVGRVLPYAVSPLLGSIRLPPGAPALFSFLLPCLAGLGFLGVPLLIYWLASPQLGKLWPLFSPDIRGGAVFAAMGAGIAAYLAGPLLLYLEEHLTIGLVLMTASVMVLAYWLGRTLDHADPLPMSQAFVPLVLTMPAGAALLHADVTGLAIAAASIVAIASAFIVWNARSRHPSPSPPEPTGGQHRDGKARISRSVPADVQELVQRVENPDYQQFPLFDRGWDRVRGFLEGRCLHLGLYGARGSGKTATVEALTSRLAREFESRGCRLVRLCGTCPQPIGEPIVYAPFRQALAQHFEVNLLAPPGAKLQQISQALGGIFGSVVPFGRILFPSSAADGAFAARPEEIHAAIIWMLRRLAKSGPVLLLLDDVQWFDPASTALVQRLFAEFPAESDISLAIVLVASDKECFKDLGLDVAQHGLEALYPSTAEQAQILTQGIGLRPVVAEEILTRVGATREAVGGLLWPLQVVGQLARAGALVRTKEGFAWANGRWPAEFTIPSHIQAAIQDRWDRVSEHRAVLECAACGCSGCEFRASVLADALHRPCLDMVAVLDEIERKTGMIHDVRDRDDIYAFHSSFLLEVIRGRLGILGRAARRADIPQVVREYHARLAVAVEAALKTSASTLDEVANHFYAAGPRYAAKGVEYCLQAANAAAAGYDFQRAKNYLEMAAECAEFSGAGPSVETARQIVICQEAQVTSQGQQREAVAKAELEYLNAHADAPAQLVLAVAELCYEAGHRSHNREPWYAEAKRLCQRIVAHPHSPQEEAQARHIMGTSQPPEQRAERIAELRKAYELLANVKPEEREASRWFARIVNSLAKELGKGTADERAEAKRLFEFRLRLEEERRLGDLRGVAVAMGGLGRLQWYGEPKDVPGAVKHFRGDLEISEAIGDVVAQAKMHSLLGACAWETNDVEQAAAHYQRSGELAADSLDRCYAHVGLLRCYRRLGRHEPFEAAAKQLLDLLEGRNEKLPPDCETPLRKVLQGCDGPTASDTVRKLRNRIGQ